MPEVLRFLRRADTKAVVVVASALLVVVAALSVVLYAFAGMESLEEADRLVRQNARLIEAGMALGQPVEDASEQVLASASEAALVIRHSTRGGEVLREWGRWPAATRTIPAKDEDGRRLRGFRLLHEGGYVVTGFALESGDRLDLALSLTHFAEETAELGRGLVIVTLLSAAAAVLAAFFATRHAFSPLRRTTSLIAEVNAGNLGRRVPTRETGDPVDRHAEALNRALAKIDASFARVRHFSGQVTHELRTPLNRIRNVAEVALLEEDDSELRPALEAIKESAESLSEVVGSLLLLAELDRGRAALQRATFDGDDWIRRTMSIYQPLFEERGTKLSVEGQVGEMIGDRRLLDRILVNLLENALRHAGYGGVVEVRATRSEPHVTVSVDDSGPGIPPEDRERAFVHFVRFGAALRSRGSGLGLPLARAVARAHGGDIAIDESPLGGARLIWWIPTGRGADSGARTSLRP